MAYEHDGQKKQAGKKRRDPQKVKVEKKRTNLNRNLRISFKPTHGTFKGLTTPLLLCWESFSMLLAEIAFDKFFELGGCSFQ